MYSIVYVFCMVSLIYLFHDFFRHPTDYIFILLYCLRVTLRMTQKRDRLFFEFNKRLIFRKISLRFNYRVWLFALLLVYVSIHIRVFYISFVIYKMSFICVNEINFKLLTLYARTTIRYQCIGSVVIKIASQSLVCRGTQKFNASILVVNVIHIRFHARRIGKI